MQKLEASFLKTGGVTNDGTEGGDGNNKGGGDLFSEIHLNEVKKLERQLEQVEAEKGMLFQRLRDAQDSSDVARHEAASRHVQLAKLDAYLASLLHLHETVETPTNASVKLFSIFLILLRFQIIIFCFFRRKLIGHRQSRLLLLASLRIFSNWLINSSIVPRWLLGNFSKLNKNYGLSEEHLPVNYQLIWNKISSR